MKIKYLEQRDRKNGTVWVVNPPKYVRTLTGRTYESFGGDRDAAVRYANKVAAEYQTKKTLDERGTVHIDPKSVAGLVHHYYTTANYAQLTKLSQQAYRYQFKVAMDTVLPGSKLPFGRVRADMIDVKTAKALHQHLCEEKSLHAANQTVKVLKLVWNVAFDDSLVTGNPWTRVKCKATPTRTVVWTPEQVVRFITAADELDLSCVGDILLVCHQLCQRPVDVRNMTWGQYQGGKFSITQSKTGQHLRLSTTPDLEARLRAKTRERDDDFMFRLPSTGKPLDRRLLARKAQLVRDHAGLPKDYWIADMRRTGATELADNGATEDELRAVTGHKTRQILSTYVQLGGGMAQRGMDKRKPLMKGPKA